MTTAHHAATTAPDASNEMLCELVQRVEDINGAYRCTAEKMGHLYMRADEYGVATVTSGLDKPMRNASENERLLAALLQSLRTRLNKRKGD